jgi:hypothetical protein
VQATILALRIDHLLAAFGVLYTSIARPHPLRRRARLALSATFRPGWSTKV